VSTERKNENKEKRKRCPWGGKTKERIGEEDSSHNSEKLRPNSGGGDEKKLGGSPAHEGIRRGVGKSGVVQKIGIAKGGPKANDLRGGDWENGQRQEPEAA